MTSLKFTAKVLAVTDGDTLKLAVLLGKARGKDKDYGFHIRREAGWLTLHYGFRLLGCNAWEHKTPGGDAATINLRALLPVGTLVTIMSISNDKYSRYDALVTLPDGRDLAGVLIEGQWAAAWDGSGARPLPPWPRTLP